MIAVVLLIIMLIALAAIVLSGFWVIVMFIAVLLEPWQINHDRQP